MTNPDFAELKEKLTSFDESKFTTNLCDFGMSSDLEIKRLSAKEQFDKSAAIISELIDIIQSQSEVLESINNDFGFFHHANKRYIESGKDKQDVTKIGTPIRIATEKLETCVSETTTRLQKLREVRE